MSIETLSVKLGATVGIGGTFNIPYPSGKSADDYAGNTGARLYSIAQGPIYQRFGDFSLAYTGSNIVVTLSGAVGFTKGDTVFLDQDVGTTADKHLTVADPDTMSVLTPMKINLGAPIASDSNGAVESQACTALAGLATGINGVLAADGVATFDVPRNVVAAWTDPAAITITGTDVYGNVMVESSASGTSLAGKKAFKTVTGVAVSADVTALTVGTSKVLGLPGYLADVTDVISELQDNAKAVAGTVVAGVTDAATATTGDVRGTYTPNGTPNGTLRFNLVVLARDPSAKGGPQFAG